MPVSTRSGDLDPGLVWYLAQAEDITAQQLNKMVNYELGLLGGSETSSDLRDFAAALGGLDTPIFAGGIGENAPVIHARICDGLSVLGVQFGENRNAVGQPVISADAGHVQVRVIRTDEDVIIAKAVFRMLAGTEPSQHAHFEE